MTLDLFQRISAEPIVTSTVGEKNTTTAKGVRAPGSISYPPVEVRAVERARPPLIDPRVEAVERLEEVAVPASPR